MSSVTKQADIVIVGAGFAGAATAYHLSRRTRRSVLLVEQESRPGLHASGRNAGLVLQSVSDPTIRQLLLRSRQAYSRMAKAVGYFRTGSILLGRKATLDPVLDESIESEWLDPDELKSSIELVRGHLFEAALRTVDDGVMELPRFLNFYLQEALGQGVELLPEARVLGIVGPSPFSVSTTSGMIRAEVVVNAAGAWSTAISSLAGAATLKLSPLKRHLFRLDVTPRFKGSSLPFIWDMEQDFYFRSERGGLLFSLCDETPSDNLIESIEPDIRGRLERTILGYLPGFRKFREQDLWSCFRTHSPDALPIVGWDPKLPGFYWVAGLGGYGMGASWEIGRLAAKELMTPGSGKEILSPSRFFSTSLSP